MSLRILGLIPARGGSKGVQNKNLRVLLGKSLVERAYESAEASGIFIDIILSTDSEEIADHGRSFGMVVPFIRPKEFATDQAPMIWVAKHALEFLESAGKSYDALILLQPTSPLRTAEHLRKASAMLEEADSVCSVIPIPLTHCPHYVMKIDGHGRLDHFLPEGKKIKRRQDVPQAYTRDGTIFGARSSVIRDLGTFYGSNCQALLLSPSEVLSIDSEEDWQEAENRMVGMLE